MIGRALIRVTGPSGAGKTTFVEALLARTDLRGVSIARCQRDDTLTEAREEFPTDDPELRRYLAAGAFYASRYHFPKRPDPDDAFFVSGLMESFASAVVLEGDSPVTCVDLAVHIVPAGGGELLKRRMVAPDDRGRSGLDAMEALLRHPDGIQRLVGDILGDAAAQVMGSDPEFLEQHRRQWLAEIDQLRSAPAPQPTERWTIREGHRGIEHARVVVVNVRGADERASGEALLEEVTRLRKDRAVFDDVLGRRASRVAVTAVAADLTDPRDPGTKKALARVCRAITAATR